MCVCREAGFLFFRASLCIPTRGGGRSPDGLEVRLEGPSSGAAEDTQHKMQRWIDYARCGNFRTHAHNGEKRKVGFEKGEDNVYQCNNYAIGVTT
jgi:hypothetical protein